ncbi:thiosulfate sulfurtransferase-like isoform X3 [Crassostrea virginica]
MSTYQERPGGALECLRARMADELFVSCRWLRDRIRNDPQPQNLVILDVSWASDKDMEEDYHSGHIPGARYFNIMDDNHTEMYPRNLPSAENFTSRAREAGINNDSHLVLYSKSQHGGMFVCGRAWWTFKYFGHKRISILDGGYNQWLEENGDVSTQPRHYSLMGNFTVNIQSNMRVDFDEMVQRVERKDQMIDSRASDKLNLQDPDTYIGNAINIPMSVLVKDYLIRPKEELRTYFTDQKVNLNEPVICYCNSGMSSCSLVLALTYCGAKARLYSGGFNEWRRRRKSSIL